MSATPDPSRSRPTSMLVSLVLRVIAPLRMAISLPRAALGGGDSKPRAAWPPKRRPTAENVPRSFCGERPRAGVSQCGEIRLVRARTPFAGKSSRPPQEMTEYEYETDKIRG